MAGGGITGAGGVFEQFAIWGVLMQLAGAILTPITQQVLDETFPKLPSMRLSPQQCADLVLRGWWDRDSAAAEAASSGISGDRFDRMVQDVGEPIALQQLLDAYRRGIIGWDTDNIDGTSVLVGIKQSRVRDQWANVIQALAVVPIPVGDAVSAVVKGQITHQLGEQIAYYGGISSTDFQVLVNTAGNPPGPGELVELARRGLIPVHGTGPSVLSFQQGIYEGLTKDKWEPAFEQLMVYLPPPRTVTALERSGSLSPAQAQTLYQDAGLDPTLAAVYSHNASMVKLVKSKDLAEGTVLTLYRTGVIPAGEASALLATLGYSTQEAAWLMAWTDLHRELATLEKAITRVSTLYVARKIGETSAVAALGALGLPGSQQDELLKLWTLEREATVKVLTPTEISDALKYAIISQPEAQTALEALGYDAFDAWVLLSVHLLGPQGTPPAQSGNITGQAP